MPPGQKSTQVAAGWKFSLGINTDGHIIHWGFQTNGQAQVPEGVFTAVSAGYDHGLALGADGRLAAWGGLLSIFPYGQGTVPEDPRGPTSYTAISAGECFNLALRADGSIWAWGYNDNFQCSAINNSPENDPTLADFVPFTQINAGGHHGVALRADGKIRAWGGTGYSTGGVLPPNANNETYVAIGAGHYTGFAVKASDRSIIGWGGNGCEGTLPTTSASGKVKFVDGGYKHGYCQNTRGEIVAWVNPATTCSACGQGAVPVALQGVPVISIATGNSNYHNIVIVY